MHSIVETFLSHVARVGYEVIAAFAVELYFFACVYPHFLAWVVFFGSSYYHISG